ncbi:MAG: MvaI/BcnI restriction endonuclease family protein, partial [Akkermansiaceae bacterium]|nr:MvaI/BcnI restriction endonuclease family protein [Akkermansiaceae bacterium]
APNDLLNKRLQGRVLFLGVTGDGQILGYVAQGGSELATELISRFPEPSIGVFTELFLPSINDESPKAGLLRELTRINDLQWIISKRLSKHGAVMSCNAPNCGGYTLEAELGITPNGRSEPDFLGFEVKQTAVPHFERLTSGTITLMTPEPTGGIYSNEGAEHFVRKYGYPDKKGREDRLNFGGVHRAGARHHETELTLRLLGFQNGKISDKDGSLALVSDAGDIAASWDFKGLMHHWARKHAHAVYVPSMMRKVPVQAYCYSDTVRLAEQPDFLRLLEAFESGVIYYDPGIKMELASTAKPKMKLRSQFRIRSRDIPEIYGKVETVNVKTGLPI